MRLLGIFRMKRISIWLGQVLLVGLVAFNMVLMTSPLPVDNVSLVGLCAVGWLV